MQNEPSKLSDLAEAGVLDQIVVRLIEPHEQERWNQLVSQHHYLKNANLVGERLCYLVELGGRWLALLGWSAAAYHIGPRDQWIGWSDNQRRARLRLLANNARFCLLTQPGEYPNLASRALALNLRRLSKAAAGVSISLPAEAPDKIASVICLEIKDKTARVVVEK